jgi:hypothetical protein
VSNRCQRIQAEKRKFHLFVEDEVQFVRSFFQEILMIDNIEEHQTHIQQKKLRKLKNGGEFGRSGGEERQSCRFGQDE